MSGGWLSEALGRLFAPLSWLPVSPPGGIAVGLEEPLDIPGNPPNPGPEEGLLTVEMELDGASGSIGFGVGLVPSRGSGSIGLAPPLFGPGFAPLAFSPSSFGDSGDLESFFSSCGLLGSSGVLDFGSPPARAWASGDGVCSCILSPMTAPHRHKKVQMMPMPILCSIFMPVLLRSDGW